LVKSFLEATDEYNAAFTGTDEQWNVISTASGMDLETTKSQVNAFIMPSIAEQMDTYFGENGIAADAAASLGLVFSDSTDKDALSKTIDSSFLQ